MAFPRPYGRYVLEERIAMGGMAEIFRARTATEGFQKRVCIKRVLPNFLDDPEFVTMFRDEARTAAKLQHANVVAVFDFGEVTDEGGTTLYLAMELIEGSDLRRIAEASRKKKIPFSLGEVVQTGIDVCRGLHHAHTLQEDGRPLGIVHRDISPHNILVSRHGEVKVTDFGIARAAERATHTSTGIVKGKVAYMSPEQAEGRPFDHRLDQWATGVVLWEMLCGARLFSGENDMVILRKLLNHDVPVPSSLRAEIPPALDAIVMRALAAEPAERFPDLRQMELALQRFLFSGAVDPATAEVRAVFPRIVDVDSVPPVRRTNVLPAPSAQAMEPSSVEASRARTNGPATAAAPSTVFDIADLQSTSDDGQPVATSSSSPSIVFTNSGGNPASRSVAVERARSGPTSPAPATVMVEDPALLAAAGDAFAQQNSSASRPSPRAAVSPPRSATMETQIDAGALSAEVSRLAGDGDDGTPATRTAVPRAEAPAAASMASMRPAAAPGDARRPRAALLAVGVVTIAIAGVGVGRLSSSAMAPDATTAPPPTTSAPPAPPAPPPPTTTTTTSPPAPPPTTTTSPPPATPTTTPDVTTVPAATAPATTAPATTAPATTAAAPAAAKPRATGKLAIDVNDGWAHVAVDGANVGDTPLTLAVPAGRHVVTLTRDDGKKKSVSVVVPAGDKLVLVRESL